MEQKSHTSRGTGQRSSFRSGTRRPSSSGGYRRSSPGGYQGNFGGSSSFRRRPAGGGGYRRGGAGRGRGGARRGDNLNTALFIKKASGKTLEVQTPKHKFVDFGFNKQIEENLTKKGYVTPTPVQDAAIPIIMSGKDIVALAHTGTGKTGAFLLPLIEKVLKNPDEGVLILAPTRELALQIDDEFRTFAANLKLYSAFCVGGMPIGKQIFNLRRNPNFVIGTPGRIQDLFDRRVLNLKGFTNVVLDEVDHMLDMGFIDPIRKILKELPEVRHSLFFSATMPPRIKDLIHEFSKAPTIIDLKKGDTTDNVDQDIIRITDRSQKFTELHKLLSRPELTKVLIFTETKREVEALARDLATQGFKANSIHGDKRQRERQRVLQMFKDNHVTILVATDVAARGLDIKDITHVINYTIPQTHADYVHRIGRTGRGSKKGMAYTFVS